MSPKERVRANIYKELLRQEKAKNKKISMMSICFIFVGIAFTSTLNSLTKPVVNVSSYAKLDKQVNVAKEENKEDSMATYMFKQLVSDDSAIKINPDEFFVLDNAI